MLKHWLTLIAAFFVLGVAAGEAAPGASDEPPADSADDDEPNLDLDLGGVDDEPPPSSEPDHKAEAAEAKREAKELREKNERYERELGEARQQRQQAHGESEEDKLRREEDAKLSRPTGNGAGEITDLEKWQIRANRELRAGRTQSAQALAQAHDISDKTTFSLLATKEPLLFKRYEARVEEELVKLRAKGQNAPREALYTFLLGQDMRAGKLTRKKAAPAADPNKTQVPRGKTPGARSDVSARSGMSEREKRAKRLENQQI